MEEYILPTVKEYNFIADTHKKINNFKELKKSLHLFLTKPSLLELPPIEATHWIY